MKDAEKVSIVDVFCSASASSQNDLEVLLIPSLERLSGDVAIRLHLVDYTGTNKLKVGKSKHVDITVHRNSRQLGFGAAHNFLFSKVKPVGFFLIINSDISCDSNLVRKLLTASKQSDVGIVEARQLPFEHPKGYSQDTMETNWASGACILVNPEFFKAVGGFDEAFWMYCEDVDLSWQCWLSGYRIVHCPEAVVYHYTGGYFGYRDERYYHEHLWGGVNFLYLSYKYWGDLGLWNAKTILNKQKLPEFLKEAILTEFDTRKTGYVRAKRSKISLSSLKDKIDIVGYNCYK